jgi:hypothetical protein
MSHLVSLIDSTVFSSTVRVQHEEASPSKSILMNRKKFKLLFNKENNVENPRGIDAQISRHISSLQK